MVGLDGEKFFKNLGGLFPVGEGCVVVRFGGEQRERVEDGGFVVVGIGGVHLLHRVGVGLGALGRIELRAAVVGGDGGNVSLLSRRGFRGQFGGRVRLFQT